MSNSKDDINDIIDNDEVDNEIDEVLDQATGASDADAEESSDNNSEVSIESLQAELEEANAKASENWDKALRIQAEMDNLTKAF